MNIGVRYYSRGGNTKKLADAIAAAVGATALDTSAPMDGRVDLLFLGASVYAGGPDREVVTFIRQNARDIGRIVVFSTSASGKSTQARIKAVAADCGVEVSDVFFHCPGAWTLFHKGRPNAQDCDRAADFARAQIG